MGIRARGWITYNCVQKVSWFWVLDKEKYRAYAVIEEDKGGIREGAKCSGKEWVVFLEYLRVVKDGKRWKGRGTRWPVAGRSKEDGKREIWRDYLPWWTNELSTYSIVNILLVQLCCFPRFTIWIEEQYWIGRNLLGNSSLSSSRIFWDRIFYERAVPTSSNIYLQR